MGPFDPSHGPSFADEVRERRTESSDRLDFEAVLDQQFSEATNTEQPLVCPVQNSPLSVIKLPQQER